MDALALTDKDREYLNEKFIFLFNEHKSGLESLKSEMKERDMDIKAEFSPVKQNLEYVRRKQEHHSAEIAGLKAVAVAEGGKSGAKWAAAVTAVIQAVVYVAGKVF